MLVVLSFLVIFGLAAVYGGFEVLRGTRRIRAPRAYADALFTWSERPGGMLKNDFPSWLAITFHRLALLAIGLIAVLIVLVRPLQGQAVFGGRPSFLLGALLYAVMAMIGFFFGFSLFGPFAEYLGGDHHYAASEAGMLIGGSLIPWEAFGHFDVNAERTVIRVWSRSLRGTQAMTIAPTAVGDVEKLARILRGHISESPQVGFGVIQRYALPLLMLCLCAPFVLLAGLLLLVPSGLALVGEALCMYALLALGGSLIMRLIYGGKARRLDDPTIQSVS